MPLALASHVTSRQAAQFGIDQRDQFLQRLLVPITPGSEELRNFLGDGSVTKTEFVGYRESCRIEQSVPGGIEMAGERRRRLRVDAWDHVGTGQEPVSSLVRPQGISVRPRVIVEPQEVQATGTARLI